MKSKAKQMVAVAVTSVALIIASPSAASAVDGPSTPSGGGSPGGTSGSTAGGTPTTYPPSPATPQVPVLSSVAPGPVAPIAVSTPAADSAPATTTPVAEQAVFALAATSPETAVALSVRMNDPVLLSTKVLYLPGTSVLMGATLGISIAPPKFTTQDADIASESARLTPTQVLLEQAGVKTLRPCSSCPPLQVLQLLRSRRQTLTYLPLGKAVIQKGGRVTLPLLKLTRPGRYVIRLTSSAGKRFYLNVKATP